MSATIEALVCVQTLYECAVRVHTTQKTWYLARMRILLGLGLALASLFQGEATQGHWSVTCGGNQGAAVAYTYDSDGDMTDDWRFPVVPSDLTPRG